MSSFVGAPLPSAGTLHVSECSQYETWELSIHSTWSSTEPVSASGVSFSVFRSSTYRRQLPWLLRLRL